MVGGLLGNVVAARVVGKVPVAREGLAQDRVEGLLDAGRSDVPSAQIELDDGHEALGGILDVGDG